MATTDLAQQSNTQTLTNVTPANSFNMARMLPTLALSVVEGSIPFLAYTILKASFHMSDITALTISTVIPVAFTLFNFAHKRSLDVVSLITLVGLVGSIAAALISGNAQMLLIRESALGAVFGIVLLISLFWPRPLFFYMARHFRAGNNPAAVALFNQSWSKPQMRNAYRLVTLVWGVGTLAEFALRVYMVYTLSIATVLALSSIAFPAIYITMGIWTMWYMMRVRKQASK